MTLYNDSDAGACAWLRELIEACEIAPGTVDERSICDLRAADLAGHHQCHFFGGIGGWPYALRLAGVPDDFPIWTASCPCQPYSSAGKQLGNADARDLWPVLMRLIRECRPERICGEQVSSAIGHGWLDRLACDLEGEGYAVGACVLGAHSVCAPHRRQRLYWCAELGDSSRDDERRNAMSGAHGEGLAAGGPGRDGVGESEQPRLEGHAGDGDRGDESRWLDAHAAGPVAEAGGSGVADSAIRGQRADGGASGECGHDDERGSDGDMANSAGSPGAEHVREQGNRLRGGASANHAAERGGAGFWSSAVPLACRDGKFRLVPPGIHPLVRRMAVSNGRKSGDRDLQRGGEHGQQPEDGGDRSVNRSPQPGFRPLADGLPAPVVRGGDQGAPEDADATSEARVMRLRGYGNAIVPQVAAAFLRAWLGENKGGAG